MLKTIKTILKPKVKPLNKIVILKHNLLHNISMIEMMRPEAHLFPVVKSNAYGYWLKEVLKILKKTDIHTVCVDSFIEYQYVKNHSNKKVLVLWETFNENYKNYDFSIASFCIFNLKTLKYLASLKKKIRVHLFLNTWMNREWISEKDLNKFLNVIKKSKLILEWVCSHLASADDIKNDVTDIQIGKFKEMYKKIEKAGLKPEYRHISASSWTLKIKDEFFNAFRPGIAIYWYNPLLSKDKDYKFWKDLKPALELYSTVVSVHDLVAEEWISYNLTYKTKKATKVATIPFGYAEGLDRKFSNNMQVKCKGKYYPIRGRICMNYCSFEIWNAKIKPWDEVQIISSNPKDKNSVINLAKNIDTITYEIITRLNSNIHREIK